MYHMIDCFILYDIDRMRKYIRKTRRRGRRTRKGGDNKNIRLSNRTQFNNYMRNRLSSSNQLNTLRNIAAHEPANNYTNQANVRNNRANMNVRRPATIRNPIPPSPPQGPQGFRNLQAAFVANKQLRNAQHVK